MYLQGIVVGPDGMIYVANNSTELGGTDQVLQINPTNNSVTVLSYTPSAAGTTALASGSYKGNSGVFVGNLSYGPAPNYALTGSIDFINTSSLSSSTVLSSTAAASIVYLSNGLLLTTDTTYWYVVSLAGTPSATQEGMGNAIAASTSNMYVSNAVFGSSPSSTLYVCPVGGSSVTSLGAGSNQCLASLAFSQTTSLLYMADTYTGKVWTYNGTSESSTSIVSTNQNSTGPIYFYNGVGYIAVGSYENTAPGVYYFNPSSPVPTAVQVGGNN
jgi:hypothetical protein